MRDWRRRQWRQYDPGSACGRGHRGQGGRAGLARRWLLNHAVQSRRQAHSRSWPQQLQAVRVAQSVRYASGSHHLGHPGYILVGLLLCFHFAVPGLSHCRVRSVFCWASARVKSARKWYKKWLRIKWSLSKSDHFFFRKQLFKSRFIFIKFVIWAFIGEFLVSFSP